jgi:hypothetical protein
MEPASLFRWAGLLVALLALALTAMLLAGAPSKGDAPGPPTEEADERQQLTQVTGEVRTTMDADGNIEYTLRTDDGREIELDAGPPWFYVEDHPLKPLVGKTVTVTGEEGINWKGRPEIDVFSVASDGRTTEIRSAGGPPPWVAGPDVAGGAGFRSNGAHPGCEGLNIAAAVSGNERVISLAKAMGCSIGG